jgi:hypothetical protein
MSKMPEACLMVVSDFIYPQAIQEPKLENIVTPNKEEAFFVCF